MATRVLIINKQLVFAVTIKQALEQTGAYEVHPFTAADAAIEYLQEHPQDVALVDFTLPGTIGPILVQRLRGVQPDLLLIASPRPAEATEVMRALRLQGMINLPFSVRDIVPLIEQAVENRQQDAALFGDVTTNPARPADYPTTRILEEEPRAQTRPLDEEPQIFGKTRILDDVPSDAPPTPSKTKILDDAPSEEEINIQTRIFDDDQPAPVEKFYGQTRILDDDQQPVAEDWQTHILEDAPAEIGGETPQFRRPGSVPEISNLDSVLANLSDSSLFEPPMKEGDTPSVPTKDSDALRQFLATAGEFAKDTSFDDILEAIDSDQVDAEGARQRSDFDNLVDSMRSSEPHTALPGRQDQFMDFILTSGMDAVLQEIEKVKTGTLRQYIEPEQAGSSTFQKLAEEEPPMPTLEESGTIGDLMIGVSDKSFRNVLAVLRGEDVSEEIGGNRTPTISEQEKAEAFARFYEPLPEIELPTVEPIDLPAPPEMPEMPAKPSYAFEESELIEEEPGDSTLAQIILETALDENTLGFSLDELMSNIENRLSVYRPDVQPLPSWGPAFERRKREEEKLIREPDFLPEELPEGELPTALPEMEVTDRFNIETTKPSSRQVIEPHPEDIETDSFAQSVQSRRVAEDTPVEMEEWLPAEEGQDFTPLPPEPAPVAEEEPQADLDALGDWPEETLFAETLESRPVEQDYADEWTLEHPATTEAWDVEQPVAEPEPASEVQAEEVWDIEQPIAEPVEEAAPDVPAEEAWAAEAQWPAELEPQAEWDAPAADAVQPALDDARIAQMALNLTQASLELTSEATLLTREGELVASAGHLAPEDLDELSVIIANDWDTQDEGARVRYITLPSSGRDYMLYSLKTDEGFTLSLIFAGTTPLRVIRRQGQRLALALQAVPEAQVIEEAQAPIEEAPPTAVEEAPSRIEVRKPPEVKVLTAYTFVWLVRDPNLQLSQSVTQAIHAGLSIQLAELGWRIKALQASNDHVYLWADVPGETPAQQIIRDLKRRSADIAQTQDRSLDAVGLWADSYFVLTPGRELDMDEIAEFINFERM